MAKANPLRFSTKYQDDETDLLYYGYRYLKPWLGAWSSADPFSEHGGLNLYCFAQNNPICAVDFLPRITVSVLTPRTELITQCGSADAPGKPAGVKFDFVLDAPAAEDGYIVQENMFYFEYETRIGTGSQKEHYWEAWFVKANDSTATTRKKDSYTDRVRWPGFGPTVGSGGVNTPVGLKDLGPNGGKIKFFFKRTTGDLGDAAAKRPPAPETGWTWRRSSPYSGDLPSTRDEPDWWKYPPDGGETISARSVYTIWDCLCPAKISHMAVEPGLLLK